MKTQSLQSINGFLLILSIIFLSLASCSEEKVVVEEEDRTALDSLETVIEVTTEDLTAAKNAKNSLQRRLDSLQAVLDNAGNPTGQNSDISYTVQVIDGSQSYINGRTESLPDATITISQGNVEQQLVTDGTGMVVFPELESGFISVTVEIAGFSDVYMIVDLTDGGTDPDSDTRYATTQVMVFPTEGSTMHNISGVAYYDQDLTNFRTGAPDDPNHPYTGASIFEEVPAGSVFKIECIPSGIPNNSTARPGAIVNAIYAGLVREAEIGANGTYSVNVPVVFLTNGNNLFNYIGPESDYLRGTRVTATGNEEATWVSADMFPYRLDDITYFPGGNTISDVYYFSF